MIRLIKIVKCFNKDYWYSSLLGCIVNYSNIVGDCYLIRETNISEEQLIEIRKTHPGFKVGYIPFEQAKEVYSFKDMASQLKEEITK